MGSTRIPVAPRPQLDSSFLNCGATPSELFMCSHVPAAGLTSGKLSSQSACDGPSTAVTVGAFLDRK